MSRIIHIGAVYKGNNDAIIIDDERLFNTLLPYRVNLRFIVWIFIKKCFFKITVE